MTGPRKATKLLEWIAAILLGLSSAFVVFWQNSRLTVLWDLSYILENSYRMSIGDIPYRDFPFPYAPLTFLTQALLIKLTGRVFIHHVIYCAVVAVISILVTWQIVKRILNDVQGGRVIAISLTAPLVVLGIYCIFPHPFYDPDCTMAVLVCLLIAWCWAGDSGPKFLSIIMGMLVPIPVFIKQNTGLAFNASFLSAIGLLLLLDLIRRQRLFKYLWFLLGFVLTSVISISLIQWKAGIANYIHWTVKFAAERRTPAWSEMLQIYTEPHLKWWLACALAGVILLAWKKSNAALRGVAVALLSAPFVWPVIYLFLDDDASERAERLVNLWPLMLILAVFVTAITFKRRTKGELLLTLSIVGTANGAFLSQQLWGSTYALWPFGVILIALILRALIELSTSDEIEIDQSTATVSHYWPGVFTALVTLSLSIAGFFYTKSHERLDYANLDDGDLVQSKLPALRGMAMRGSWLPDFEELVNYVDKNIPVDEGILYLPGEDLFYYTTGRRPQFPVLMFDHTVNPLSPQQIVDTARERNIKWLITKNDLQLEEEPLEKKDELMALLDKEFESVESLDNYEIYKRRTAELPDDEDDSYDSDSKDQSPPR